MRTMRPYLTLLTAVALSAISIALASSTWGATTGPEIVAHRGGTSPAEGTIAAIYYAQAKGATAVEADVRYTLDGKAVVMHDQTVDRTTTCTGLVSGMKWSALSRCPMDGAPGARVPTYQQALDTAKTLNLRLFVHMKQSTAGTIKPLVAAASKAKWLDRTVFIADGTYAIERAKANGAKWYGQVANSPARWNGPGQYVLPYNMPVTAELVVAAHKAGKRVYPVESAPITLAGVLGLGVDGFLFTSL